MRAGMSSPGASRWHHPRRLGSFPSLVSTGAGELRAWVEHSPASDRHGVLRTATAQASGTGGEGEEDGSSPHCRARHSGCEGEYYLVSMLGECEWVKNGRSPFCAPNFSLPTRRHLDRPLVFGAVLFGIGWGLVGHCPGPALAGVGLGNPATDLFVLAMVVGMGGSPALPSLLSRSAKHA